LRAIKFSKQLPRSSTAISVILVHLVSRWLTNYFLNTFNTHQTTARYFLMTWAFSNSHKDFWFLHRWFRRIYCIFLNQILSHATCPWKVREIFFKFIDDLCKKWPISNNAASLTLLDLQNVWCLQYFWGDLFTCQTKAWYSVKKQSFSGFESDFLCLHLWFARN